MRALSSALRKQLETSVLAARRAAESASRAAVEGLGVFADRRPEHLDADQAALRNGLRAKWRQLGGDRELLVAECAYEQWHRLLFARFLAENGLLLHPQYKAPVTLGRLRGAGRRTRRARCVVGGGPVRGRDPARGSSGSTIRACGCGSRPRAATPSSRSSTRCRRRCSPPTTRLGWVYQFWQKDKKDEVNASERKIGGADLGPVTQLFTENYMVRFLLRELARRVVGGAASGQPAGQGLRLPALR